MGKMTGFWNTLTPEQQKLALEYSGDDTMGSTDDKEIAKQFAYIAYRLIEGDDVIDQFYELANEQGFTDDDGEWIHEDEGEDEDQV